MVDFGKMIDKLIEISTNEDISQEVQFKLDEVIDELIHLEIDKNDNRVLVPDFTDLSPEEMEEIKLFQMFVRDVMNDELAMAQNSPCEFKMIKIKHKDLDKILLVLKYMMDERPDLNEKLMDFYCYLREMKSIESQVKRITVDESDGVDMNLDEIIWEEGMTCPSWND